MTVDDEHQPLHTYRGFNFRLRQAVPDHLPMQPSWVCSVCSEDWPCATARERLSGEMDRVRLAMYMWTQLEAYCQDIGPGPINDMFERFIRWTR